MTLTASEVASLTVEIDIWEYAEYVCTALVAIACFGEYIADFTEWWQRDRFWRWFGSSLEHRKDRVAKFSTLVLIAALAGELLCVVVTNQLSDTLVGALGDRAEEAFSKSGDALNNASAAASQANSSVQQSSKATKDASSALTVAHGARHEADSFERDIVTAKEQAAQAESHLADALSRVANAEKAARDEVAAREKIEQKMADRVFTADQRSKFMAALVGKAKFPILFRSPEGEPARYARQILTALQGWDMNANGVGISAITIDTEVEASIQSSGLLGAPLITFGASSNESNIQVLTLAFRAAGIPVVQMEMGKQSTPEIGVFVRPKAP